MKRAYTYFQTILLLFIAISGYGQHQVAGFLKGNIDDAKLLSHAYLMPMGKMFGSSLNGGWYQSAGTHKVLGFDITFTTSIATVPNDDKFFNVEDLGLNEYVVATNSPTQAPTVSASVNAGSPALALKGSPDDPLFTLPQGAGVSLTPMILLQGSVGLPFHSELVFRYFPTVNMSNLGSMSLWGVGVKNEFKEFIPGLKLLPIDLSVMLGYTSFNSNLKISYKPNPSSIPEGYTMADFNGQKLNIDASGFTGRLLVGKTFPLIAIYAGVGYGYSDTNLGLLGYYPIGAEPVYDEIIEDPLMLNYSYSNFNGNLGFRLRFGVLAVNFDYTFGDYALYSLGLGISFR